MRHTSLKPGGYAIIVDPGAATQEFDTLQCCHCGSHWHISPGSGKVRGFCARCNGPICGPNCAVCVPKEVQLDNIEAGLPAGTPRKLMLPSGWGG